tara:strand:+ start:730 stop:1476 length:747 start_codon:yes stop_codon:yes gene_type:complete
MPTFENCVVTIDGNDLFATNASISIQNNRGDVKGYGSQGSAGQVAEGRIKGSLTASYLLRGNDPIRNLTGLSLDKIVNANIGPFRCYSGVLTSYSLSIEPYSPVTCEVKMDFYNGYDQGGSTSTMDPTGEFLHGGATTVSTDLLWSSDIIGCTYTLNQAITPRYLLGELVPYAYKRDNGTISVSLKGPDLGKVLTSPCEGYTEGTLNLTGLCTPINDEIPFSGFVVNPSINISANQEIIGSLEVFSTF